MGLLIDGKWHDQWYDTDKSGGRFIRSEAQFRNWITIDGESGFIAEPNRYHLYVSYACPWAHRTLIYRALKGLDKMISVSFVHWYMGKHGWTFTQDDQNIVGDNLFGYDYLHQLYTHVDEKYTGRVTVPILWDKKSQTIVSNESSEIIRMFNSAFDEVGAKPGDYYPQNQRQLIDELNSEIYNAINNGVYKAGFATTQKAYNEAIGPLFSALDRLDNRLADQQYLLGEQATEADWRLFPTLLRFDAIYHTHFKCNLKQIKDYKHLSRYTRDLYFWPGIIETINLEHAIYHYYQSHHTINPHGIVPVNNGMALFM